MWPSQLLNVFLCIAIHNLVMLSMDFPLFGDVPTLPQLFCSQISKKVHQNTHRPITSTSHQPPQPAKKPVASLRTKVAQVHGILSEVQVAEGGGKHHILKDVEHECNEKGEHETYWKGASRVKWQEYLKS